MESRSLSPKSYPIQETADGFTFRTDHGIDYLLYFTEASGYAPDASFADTMLMFGFQRLNGPSRIERGTGPDEAVRHTIVQFLDTHFRLNPMSVLTLVYSNQSGRLDRHTTESYDQTQLARFCQRVTKGRSAIFDAWYQEWTRLEREPTIIKRDITLYGSLLCACLFRADHPAAAEIDAVIRFSEMQKLP